MPNSELQMRSPSVSSAKLERKLRLSLPEKDKLPSTSAGAGRRRNTISDDSLPRVRKKSKAPHTPSIPEDEDETADDEIVIVNEKTGEFIRSSSAASKKSAMSSKSSKPTFTYDNGAFEGNLETRPVPRTPSLRSLEVYREQYCCCAKRTVCERYLLVAVTILAIIVIVLIIVIAVLAKNGDMGNLKTLKIKL